MSDTIQPPVNSQGRGSSSKVWLIVVIVAVVLCCVIIACGGAGYWLWENGDELFQDWLAIFPFI
jgi:hypothetical protein